MDKKTTDIVAYITLIGWIVAFLAGDKENSKFHLNQALVIFLAGIVISIVGAIPFIGWIIAAVGNVFVFVCWLLGLISAVQGTDKEVPLLGRLKLIQ